jgi:hypothetical protein
LEACKKNERKKAAAARREMTSDNNNANSRIMPVCCVRPEAFPPYLASDSDPDSYDRR